MNTDHEEAVEFAKTSKRENWVYVGNLSYVKYRDLMEFMRGGGWGNLRLVFQSLWCGREVGMAWSQCSTRAQRKIVTPVYSKLLLLFILYLVF
jgi:hypothetical protein